MQTTIRHSFATLLLAMACIYSMPAHASHIVGGGFTYTYLGDTMINGQTRQKYRIALDIYQDCIAGVPDAISQDNPAFFTFYEVGATGPYLVDTSVYYDNQSSTAVSAPELSQVSPCGTIAAASLPPLCLLKKRFIRTYYLPPNATGYTVAYQRCCRNTSIANIIDAGDGGTTFFCTIPPAAQHNTSAVFSHYPPVVICLFQPISFNCAASEPDGDSLTYELCSAYDGATSADIKPKVAAPPPYNSAPYYAPYTENDPMPGFPALSIDPTTGRLTITPSRIGRYLIGVMCKEWRDGVLISATRMEFQWTVIDCKTLVSNIKPNAGIDQTILVGAQIQFHASGGTRYLWLPGDFLNNAYLADPLGTFTQPGVYTYVVSVVNDSGCSGTDTITINVLQHSEFTAPNAFTPNGDGHNDIFMPIPVIHSTLKEFRVYNRWGNTIYHTSTTGSGWDGTYNGTKQDTGVYSWYVEYADNTGATRVAKGNVTLLR